MEITWLHVGSVLHHTLYLEFGQGSFQSTLDGSIEGGGVLAEGWGPGTALGSGQTVTNTHQSIWREGGGNEGTKNSDSGYTIT